MGVVRPLGASLVRVPRDSNRMSHPLAGAHNHGGKLSDLSGYPSALEQHGMTEEGSGFALSFVIVGKSHLNQTNIYKLNLVCP